MKKTTLLLVSVLLAISASVASAGPVYTPDVSQIQNWGVTWYGAGTTLPGGLNVIYPSPASTGGVQFNGNMALNGGAGSGWASVGIGDGWPPAVGDLQGYDGFGLVFTNTNNSVWWVNPYVTTGWTDPPWGEPANYYENGWAGLNPGETKTLVVDLSLALNLNHVTSYGFQLGANLENPIIIGSGNPSNPDNFHVDVAPVPVPGTLALACLGVPLVGWLRRRRWF